MSTPTFGMEQIKSNTYEKVHGSRTSKSGQVHTTPLPTRRSPVRIRRKKKNRPVAHGRPRLPLHHGALQRLQGAAVGFQPIGSTAAEPSDHRTGAGHRGGMALSWPADFRS